MAHDDWRVTVELSDPETGAAGALREAGVVGDVRERLGGRVAVSQDGPRLFVYADSREQAEDAVRALRPALSEHQADAPIELARWHPIEERWEDPSVPLPETEDERDAEHARREADERRQSREQGYPEWEVRIALRSHGDARDLAERLEAEGVPLLRRWRYLLVFADAEDDARELAERLEREAPEGARLEVELNGGAVWRDANPFAVFGGMGG